MDTTPSLSSVLMLGTYHMRGWTTRPRENALISMASATSLPTTFFARLTDLNPMSTASPGDVKSPPNRELDVHGANSKIQIRSGGISGQSTIARATSEG